MRPSTALKVVAPLAAAGVGLTFLPWGAGAATSSVAGSTVLINQNDAASQFVQAVGTPGTTVQIEAGVNLNLSGLSDIFVASGVQILGLTDPAHPNGPRIYTTSKPKRLLDIGNEDNYVPSDNVRISGIRLDGGRGTAIADSGDDSSGITDWSSVNVEIDHNEIYGWSAAGVGVHDGDGMTDLPDHGHNRLTKDNAAVVHIHDNYIHHNQEYGRDGYGVVLSDGATALVEQNTFDYNRHDIAGDGKDGTGYYFERNLLLPNGGVNASTAGVVTHTHVIDMHGRDSCFGFSYYCGRAGEYTDIEYNTVLYDEGTDFKLRGTPTFDATVSHNTFARSEKWNSAPGGLPIVDNAAMVQTVDLDHGSIQESDNTLGYTWDRFNAAAVTGDFDGDGRSDRMVATGQAWWYFSSLHQRWIFLRQTTSNTGFSVGDFDGDGTSDVNVGGVVYSHGTTVPIATPTAYQDAATHHLMRLSLDGVPHDTGYAMKPGTSPATARMSDGGYVTAFVGGDGALWVMGNDGKAHWAGNGLGVAPGTSPSIASDLDDDSYRIVFNASTTHLLWTYSSTTGAGTPNPDGYTLMPTTSPSITHLGSGRYQTAFVNAADNSLWEYGDAADRQVANGLGLAPGTSPSIAAAANGTYRIAFNAYGSNLLWTVVNNIGTVTTDSLKVKAGTSPSLLALPYGGYQIGFTNAADGFLWEHGAAGERRVSNGLGLAAGTNPALAPQYSGTDHAFSFEGADGYLWTVDSTNTNHQTTGRVAPGTTPATVW
jgi:hypothetical protein